MDEDSIGFSAKAPVGVWNKRIGVDYPGVFKAVLKAALAAATANAPGAISAAIDGFFAFKVEGARRPPEELAWLLIRRALAHSMAKLAVEALKRHNREPEDPDGLVAQLDAAIDGTEILINHEFIERPAEHPIVERAIGPLREWLRAYGLNDAESHSVTRRLGAYFTLALHREWAEHAADYATLDAELLKAQTPFAKADELQRAWLKNAAYLQRLILEPVFDEPFGLHDVYVPLRAYYVEETGDEADFHQIRTERRPSAARNVAVDLRRECLRWLKADDRRDSVRLISGDPGCGKTSFAKQFAAELADDWPEEAAGPSRGVLFVPLHRFNFTGDLQLTLRNYLSAEGALPTDYDPLDATSGVPRLLIFFDGLDEISEQGRPGREAIQKFAAQVDILARTLNHTQSRVFFVLGGRELSVDASRQYFQRPRQVLHAMPYLVADAKSYQIDPDTGPGDLEADLRQLWWQRYAAAKGKPYEGLPKLVDRPDLEPITSQPLLNYLLAQSLERGRLDFSVKISLNQIYGDLLAAVYERHWGDPEELRATQNRGAPRPGHPVLVPLAWEDFVRLLEEVALLAWHGAGRTVAALEVERACEELRLKDRLDAFKQGAEAGAVSLLVSFFFRQAARIGGEPTFEFTHKSFGEYLTARRLVRAIATTYDQRERNRREPEDGWTTTSALERWARMTGPTAMDTNLLDFLSRQISLQSRDIVSHWQVMLAELLGETLRRGLPMHKFGMLTFGEMMDEARNAEEALLAALYSCASAVEIASKIDWPDAYALSRLLNRLDLHRRKRIVRKCLGWLDSATHDLKHELYQVELMDGQLEGSNLRGASLSRANLADAHLVNVDLSRAHLEGAHLFASNFSGAKLVGASLLGAYFRYANLRGANLEKAHLRRANLIGARGLGEARLPEEPKYWLRAKIERKWVKNLGLDAEKLALQVVDDLDDDLVEEN